MLIQCHFKLWMVVVGSLLNGNRFSRRAANTDCTRCWIHPPQPPSTTRWIAPTGAQPPPITSAVFLPLYPPLELPPPPLTPPAAPGDAPFTVTLTSLSPGTFTVTFSGATIAVVIPSSTGVAPTTMSGQPVRVFSAGTFSRVTRIVGTTMVREGDMLERSGYVMPVGQTMNYHDAR